MKFGDLEIPQWAVEKFGAERMRQEILAARGIGFQEKIIAVIKSGKKTDADLGSALLFAFGIQTIEPQINSMYYDNSLPDIDVDFHSGKREMVFDYLKRKYGEDKIARIGSVNTLKPRSVLNEACKRFAIPPIEKFKILDVLADYSSGDSRFGHGLYDTLHYTENGKAFLEKYPEAAVMAEAENHSWHSGVHAAGIIVANEPVSDYCTIGPDGVAQIDKLDSEQISLLKIDALGLRTLDILEDAGAVSNDELYALKLNDQKVFQIFNDRKYSCIFQFEGATQRVVAEQVQVDSFETIDNITALARPGPLGGGATEHYTGRKAGREIVTYRHPKLEPILKGTYGTVLYQEQVISIVRDIGHFNWEDTTAIRKAMSASKGKEYFDRKGDLFIKGAKLENVSEYDAKEIWSQITTFGAWAMAHAHTCSYSIISYWTAYLKAYHPVAFAAACLRHAKDDPQSLEILREMVSEGVEYIPFDINLSEQHWSVKNGKLVGGFRNLIGFGPAKSAAAIEARRNGKMTEKLRNQIMEAHVKFTELYPITTKFADVYRDPEKYGSPPGARIVQGNELPPRGPVYHITKVLAKSQRDENETLRIAKRNGVRFGDDGSPTQFIDLHCMDDSGAPITLRVDRFRFEKKRSAAHEEPFGPWIMQNVHVGDVVLIKGSRIPNFSLLKVNSLLVLNNEWLIETPRLVEERRAASGTKTVRSLQNALATRNTARTN